MKQITLAILNNFTFQEIFDVVSLHLLTQHEKSINSNGDCMYRGQNGNTCAIGCLISDEEYRPSMEGETVDNLKIDVDSSYVEFLKRLQMIHDLFIVEDWYGKLVNVANTYNLEMKISKNKANFLKLVTNDGSGEKFLEELKYRIEHREEIREKQEREMKEREMKELFKKNNNEI